MRPLMTKHLSTEEAAEALGVQINTLKSWLGLFPVKPGLDQSGRLRFGTQDMAVLGSIKQMRDQGRSYDTIRDAIAPPAPEPEPEPEPELEPPPSAFGPDTYSPSDAASELDPAEILANLVATLPALADEGDPEPVRGAPWTPAEPISCGSGGREEMSRAIAESVALAVANQTELAEKYARAAHRIGELEATLRAVEAERDRLTSEIKLLAAPRPRARWSWLGPLLGQ